MTDFLLNIKINIIYEKSLDGHLAFVIQLFQIEIAIFLAELQNKKVSVANEKIY